MSPNPGAVLASTDAIIDALGGPNELAESLGFRSHHAVAMWRTRKKIADAWKPKIKELVEARGFCVTADFLAPPQPR